MRNLVWFLSGRKAWREYTELFLAATTNLDSNIWTVTGEEEGQSGCWHWSNLRVIYMQLVLTLHPNLA